MPLHPPYSGRGRIYEGDATAQDRRIKDLIRRYRADEADQTSKGQISSAGLGLANTNVGQSADPPLAQEVKFSFIVPDNSAGVTVGTFEDKTVYGYIMLTVGWKRSGTGNGRGIAYLDGWHDGTNGSLRHLQGSNPGWIGLDLTISGSDLSIVMGSSSTGVAITGWGLLTFLPFIA